MSLIKANIKIIEKGKTSSKLSFDSLEGFDELNIPYDKFSGLRNLKTGDTIQMQGSNYKIVDFSITIDPKESEQYPFNFSVSFLVEKE